MLDAHLDPIVRPVDLYGPPPPRPLPGREELDVVPGDLSAGGLPPLTCAGCKNVIGKDNQPDGRLAKRP
ncbi:hypothetical protein TRAPUB_1609 [Trametes pubescens]|uniref:Uncharacterized protein n=1 Tax=Trametes pubescens TaxID=154538 RepID=A0A1M2VJ01_TRAPU|nr:hypothetical protein TRAPUB_1609 [Trametes pubescens]